MTTRNHIVWWRLGWFTLLLLAAGCAEMAYSPESAAQQAVRSGRIMPDLKVDPNSIQVLQSQPLGKSTLVLVSYQGMQARNGPMDCLYTFEAQKGALGWTSGGGGGGCSNAKPDPTAMPISVGGNSGSGTGDPGYSSVSGLVYRPDIQSVQVTWEDGMSQLAAVSNHSYLAVRGGVFKMKKVEAIDANRVTVYTNEPQVDPAKQKIEENNGNN